MENASKALIMAATILIGVTILSLAVYLFVYFGNYAKNVEEENTSNQIAQFNSQFLSYKGKDLTVYDVITLANLAKDYNKGKTETDSREYITFNASVINNQIGSNPPNEQNIGGSTNEISQIDQDKIGEYVQDNEGNRNYKLKIYHCIITIDDITKMVRNIKITQ